MEPSPLQSFHPGGGFIDRFEENPFEKEFFWNRGL
jgi:hypothetical protein